MHAGPPPLPEPAQPRPVASSDPLSFPATEKALVLDLAPPKPDSLPAPPLADPEPRVVAAPAEPPPVDVPFAERPTPVAPAPIFVEVAAPLGNGSTSSDSMSELRVDSTSAVTASVVESRPFVSTLATGVGPQDETFVLRRKRRSRVVPILLAGVVGAVGAFFAFCGPNGWPGRQGAKAALHESAPSSVAALKVEPAVAPNAVAQSPERAVAAPAPSVAEAPKAAPIASATEAASAATPAPATPAAAPGMGTLRTDDATPGRRIFVDKRAVGQTPVAVQVKCGKHEVKIGSAGHAVELDVPCEGEITVSDR